MRRGKRGGGGGGGEGRLVVTAVLFYLANLAILNGYVENFENNCIHLMNVCFAYLTVRVPLN